MEALTASAWIALKLVIAFLAALPVAWERETSSRSAGLRTFPLVAVASCGYVMLSVNSLAGNPDAASRVVQGLMTGIGFIGGGAILKGDDGVHGTATAASIWTTGAMGAAIALDDWVIAGTIAAINFVALRLLTTFKAQINGGDAEQNELKD